MKSDMEMTYWMFSFLIIAFIVLLLIIQMQPRPIIPGVPTPRPIIPGVPTPQRIVGGCEGTRFGCCPDGFTAKANARGSNCLLY